MLKRQDLVSNQNSVRIFRENNTMTEEDNRETISQGMGIDNSWFEEKADRVVQIWKEHDKVSEALEHLAQEIKDEEFETQISITDYEKKLILAGYVIGQAASIIHAEEELLRISRRLGLFGLGDNEEKN